MQNTEVMWGILLFKVISVSVYLAGFQCFAG